MHFIVLCPVLAVFHTDVTLYHSSSIRLLAIHCSWYIWVWKDISFGKGVHDVHWKLEWNWHWKVIVLSDNERINIIDTWTVENSSCSFLMTRVFRYSRSERATGIFSCNGVFTSRFIFRWGFLLWLHITYYRKLCNRFWLAIGNQFVGKAYLKIAQLVKTPFHRGCMGVARSG